EFLTIPLLTVAAWRDSAYVPRTCWMFPGRSKWFHEVVLPFWDDRLFMENFHMTKQTLFSIADKLRPYLFRNDTVMRTAVPVEECVAIGVYYLACKTCYGSLVHLFAKGKSIIANIVIEFCLAMEYVLLCQEIKLTDFNKEIKLQGDCDADGIFFSIRVGHSGVTHDAHVFRSSLLFKEMEAGTFVPGNPLMNCAGVTIPPIILGDGAYPLRNWLMKPYSFPKTDREQKFNKMLNKCRNVIERAFGRLKARFRRLSVKIDAQIQNVNSIIAAAVIIHICERNNHILPEGEIEPLDEIEADPEDHLLDDDNSNTEAEQGEAVRNAIANYIFDHVTVQLFYW
ncbi:hypothetical protein JRQ81_017623, partial [Phrynocephalus forsythii]